LLKLQEEKGDDQQET